MYIWKDNTLTPLNHDEKFDDFQLGYGLFETMLVHQTKGIILWNEHMNRLHHGIFKLTGEKINWNLSNLYTALIQKLTNSEYYKLKLIYLPSNKVLWVSFIEFPLVNQSWKLYSHENYFRGYLPHYQLKSISYMENQLLKHYAESFKCDDYLVVNHEGHILETTMANIFFVKAHSIIETPPAINNSLLNGTIRNYLLNHPCPGFQITEADISLNKIEMYQEVFITNSLRLAQHVIQINHNHYPHNDVSQTIRKWLIQSLII